MEEYQPILLNPNHENREFRCDICNKYLSISPILFNDSIGNVCGRCFEDGETTKFKTTFQEQKVYENIASYIIFPCSYYINGCNKELKWSEVRNHEISCDFRDINCPLSSQEFTANNQGDLTDTCEWKGNNQDLVFHLRSAHETEISSTSQLKIYSSQKDSSKLLFSEVMGTFTIIVMYYLKNIGRYYCNVLMDFPFNDCKTYQYDLEVFDGTEKRCLVIPGNIVESISGNNLSKKSIKTSLELDLKSINAFLKKSTCMILRFKINRVYQDKTEPLENEDLQEIDYGQKVVPDLKCSCGDFLFSPIYICNKGHNCCDKCKCTYGYCKRCSEGFMSYKNTTLEGVTCLTKYPCANKSRGCAYTKNFKRLAFHEINCRFTVKDCLLKCGFKGMNSDMYKHIRDNHSPLQLNQETIYDPISKKSEFYPILFENQIFMLTVEYTMRYPLSIKMQCLGMDEWTYEFEFTILSSCNNIQFVSNHLCQPLSYGEDKKEISFQTITYPFDFFTQFTTDYDKIKFKINISRIKK